MKKAEHLWKGLGGHESQISPIPPERYGDRFVKFISGITMSRERAEQQRTSTTLEHATGMTMPAGVGTTVDDPKLGGINIQRDRVNPAGTEKVMERAEKQAQKSMRKHGGGPRMEEEIPDRAILAVRSSGGDVADAATLPVIGEAAENASQGGRWSARGTPEQSREGLGVEERRQQQQQQRQGEKGPVLGDANMPPESVGEVPPPTPPKTRDSGGWGGEVPPPTPPKTDESARSQRDAAEAEAGRASLGSLGGGPPPTPPKDGPPAGARGRSPLGRKKEMPMAAPPPPPGVAGLAFSDSPTRMGEEERGRVGLEGR